MSGLRLAEVWIRNFRVLADVRVPLGELTVLIGANNSGKTAFLDALDVAIGDRARATEEDLFVDGNGHVATEFCVDLLIQPAGGAEEFNDEVHEIVAEAIQIPANDPQFFVVRTRGSVDPKRGFDRRRKFVRGWEREPSKAAGLLELSKPIVSRDVLELLSFYLLDARRDVVDELRGRTSFWSRVAKDLRVEPQLKQEIEASLKALGSKLIDASPVLASVRSELDRISDAFASGSSAVSISALPTTLEVLGRGMDVAHAAPGSAPISLERHGMGTRSLAVLTIFNAFVKMRAASFPASGLAIVALEEPEAHLHPQAQRAAFQLASSMAAQRIVSTHSPFVVEGVEIFNLRHFLRNGAGATVKWVERDQSAGVPTFTEDELRKLRRFLQRRHGEVLFARLVVLFEGDTEEAAFPVFAETRWGPGALEGRVSFINVGGSGNYRHLVVTLERLRIPWLIFSDGDSAGVTGVTNALKAIQMTTASTSSLVMLPTASGGQDYEAYLIAEGFRPDIENAIATTHGPAALSDYRTKRAAQCDYGSQGWEERLVSDFMDDWKAALGAPVAKEIVKGRDTHGLAMLPVKVKELFDLIDVRLQQ